MNNSDEFRSKKIGFLKRSSIIYSIIGITLSTYFLLSEQSQVYTSFAISFLLLQISFFVFFSQMIKKGIDLDAIKQLKQFWLKPSGWIFFTGIIGIFIAASIVKNPGVMGMFCAMALQGAVIYFLLFLLDFLYSLD